MVKCLVWFSFPDIFVAPDPSSPLKKTGIRFVCIYLCKSRLDFWLRRKFMFEASIVLNLKLLNVTYCCSRNLVGHELLKNQGSSKNTYIHNFDSCMYAVREISEKSVHRYTARQQKVLDLRSDKVTFWEWIKSVLMSCFSNLSCSSYILKTNLLMGADAS